MVPLKGFSTFIPFALLVKIRVSSMVSISVTCKFWPLLLTAKNTVFERTRAVKRRGHSPPRLMPRVRFSSPIRPNKTTFESSRPRQKFRLKFRILFIKMVITSLYTDTRIFVPRKPHNVTTLLFIRRCLMWRLLITRHRNTYSFDGHTV